MLHDRVDPSAEADYISGQRRQFRQAKHKLNEKNKKQKKTRIYYCWHVMSCNFEGYNCQFSTICLRVWFILFERPFSRKENLILCTKIKILFCWWKFVSKNKIKKNIHIDNVGIIVCKITKDIICVIHVNPLILLGMYTHQNTKYNWNSTLIVYEIQKPCAHNS